MCIVPNQISCCLDCVHPIDESGQCLIAKLFEKPVNPEHGCSWRVSIKRKAVLTNAELIDKKHTVAKVFLIARFFIDRPDWEAELVKAVIHRCCEEIDKQPTIEPEERHGKWIPTEYDSYADGSPLWDKWECSECGHEHSGEEDTLTAFCPDCGADMRELSEDAG